MAQKNDTPALILALLVTLGLLGVGGWLLAGQFGLRGGGPSTGGIGQGILGGGTSDPQPTGPVTLSRGSVSLLPNPSPAKQAGLAAYGQGNYPEAAQQFGVALQAQRNDPEALIYQQNALAQAGQTLALGAALPVATDENAALELMRGIAQAQQEINQAGGINGSKLVLVLADDRNNPTSAQAVAQAFAQDSSILGVIGHYASDISLDTLQTYEAAKLPTISPVSTSIRLSNASSYFFRTVPSDYIAARALAEHSLSKLQRQRAVVYFNSQSAYSQSLKGEFATAFSLGGGQVLSEVDLSQSSFSPANSLASAEQQGADVIVLLPNSGTLNKALQVVTLNQKKLPILAGDDVYSPTSLEVGGANGQGMTVAIPWHIDASPNASFPQASRNLWYATVNWRTALSYDAVQAIAAALAIGTPSREGIQQAFKSPNFQANGASGTIRFLPSGDRNASIQLVTVEPGNGPGGFSFVPLP
ncbi:MAG: ABC transporter substrate-binding protein [Synechococcales cyanobacterium RM1_1_8]|nr:ABC transporter substrate-binding protein [Synechococcales cyanobacterium RM1_1_8]